MTMCDIPSWLGKCPHFLTLDKRTVRRTNIFRTVSKCAKHKLKHLTCGPVSSIRYRRFHSVQDLHHQIPVGRREIAWELLLDRNPNVIRDQASAGGKEDGWIGLVPLY